MMIIFDTDIVSLFAKADSLVLLSQILPDFQFAITAKIREELSVPLLYGYNFPQNIFNQFVTLIPTEPEYLLYGLMRETYNSLGKGEIEAICIAKTRQYLFASNDKKALEIALQEKVVVINSYTILKVAYEKKILDRSEITRLLKRFEEKDNTKLEIDKICS